MQNQASRILEGSSLTKILKRMIQKVFNETDSSFTAPRPGHSILCEMGKNGQKEGTLTIIPFFN
jgi:hypothetical protein